MDSFEIWASDCRPRWTVGIFLIVTSDAIDQAILAALRRDARTPHAAIGREVGLTGPAVLARIRKMEEAGTILGYRAVVAEAGLRAVVRVVTRPSADGDAASSHASQAINVILGRLGHRSRLPP